MVWWALVGHSGHACSRKSKVRVAPDLESSKSFGARVRVSSQTGLGLEDRAELLYRTGVLHVTCYIRATVLCLRVNVDEERSAWYRQFCALFATTTTTL